MDCVSHPFWPVLLSRSKYARAFCQRLSGVCHPGLLGWFRLTERLRRYSSSALRVAAVHPLGYLKFSLRLLLLQKRVTSGWRDCGLPQLAGNAERQRAVVIA
jgi:hypothetical protein